MEWRSALFGWQDRMVDFLARRVVLERLSSSVVNSVDWRILRLDRIDMHVIFNPSSARIRCTDDNTSLEGNDSTYDILF